MLHKNYFKGWYFKCCSSRNNIAFIPAFHRKDNIETASLQVITDNEAFRIPFDSLQYHENPLAVKIGKNLFSEKGIRLNIKDHRITAAGELRFSRIFPISYDIMGPFRFVPFMECRHSVYSMAHRIDGEITVNGQQYIFRGGKGYIEGDRGSSFPEKYIWTQCHFTNGSLMLSVAEIPLFGARFNGIIGVVVINGKEYRIATYLGAVVSRAEEDFVSVKQGNYRLTAKLLEKIPALWLPPNTDLCPELSAKAFPARRTIGSPARIKLFVSFTAAEQALKLSSDSGRTGLDRGKYSLRLLPTINLKYWTESCLC